MIGTMPDDVEIPPRVRRRDIRQIRRREHKGNTSACAEKRPEFIPRQHTPGKYLRVCGEELIYRVCWRCSAEIPPRVRRRESPTCDYIIKKRENRPLRSIRGGRKAACTSANFRG